MYHAFLQKMIVVRCALTIVLSDQPMGNALVGIRGATGLSGNRHFYHNSSELHVCSKS